MADETEELLPPEGAGEGSWWSLRQVGWQTQGRWTGKDWTYIGGNGLELEIAPRAAWLLGFRLADPTGGGAAIDLLEAWAHARGTERRYTICGGTTAAIPLYFVAIYDRACDISASAEHPTSLLKAASLALEMWKRKADEQ